MTTKLTKAKTVYPAMSPARHSTKLAILIALAVQACIAGIAASAEAAEAERIEYAEPVRVSNLQNRKVNESSGLAASHRTDGLFWTHNDSGDRPRLYCFDVRGNHRGTAQLKKAEAVDWEDICSYQIDGKPRLLVGDIGDNGAKRKSCRLYLVEEPKQPDGNVRVLQTIKLKYATGSMDCEALGVDAVSRKILLVEKRPWITCRVFIADLPAETEKEVKLTAKPVGQIKLPLVTGMDVSCDGRRAIVLTLGQAFEFTREAEESWESAFQRKPRTIDMPPRKQGEAICYGRAGRDLFLTSEFSPCPLYLVKAKGAEKNVEIP